MAEKEKLLGLLAAGILKFSKKGEVDIKKFGEYLLENGIVVPPVNLGDTVYWHNGLGVIHEHKVLAIQYTFDKKKNVWRLDLGDGLMPVYPHRALFLTREEAEKAAKKQMKENCLEDMERAKRILAAAEKRLKGLEG